MRFDIVTIFPEVLKEYFNSSILGRAKKDKKIQINFHNLRDFAKDKHKKVDDRPFGGGPGLVLKMEPIIKAVSKINPPVDGQKSKLKKIKIIIFSPFGKQFIQKMARDWAKKYDNIIMVCGRYEGIDARVKKIIKANFGGQAEEISVGDYILTGGELAAAIVADAVSRQIPGVLGKEESIEEKRGLFGYPTYTKPEIFEFKNKKYYVPKILLSGNHQKVKEWRKKYSKSEN